MPPCTATVHRLCCQCCCQACERNVRIPHIVQGFPIHPRHCRIANSDLQKQFDLLIQVRDELSRVYDTVNQVQDVRAQMDGLRRRLPDNGAVKPLLAAADELDKNLLSVRDDLATGAEGRFGRR